MGRLWAIVLAGGDGTRVSAFARRSGGEPVPKQYSTFGGEGTLLARALRRAEGLVPSSRILVVVAERHRRHWGPALAGLPVGNVLVQPRNRGTAAGILLPVLEVYLRRDRDASVLVLPADHDVTQEGVLRTSLLAACRAVRVPGAPLTVLGLTPEDDDPEFGWIVPGPGPASEPRAIGSFVEKPDPISCRRIQDRGALLSSFIFAARASTLLGLYEDALPGLLECFLPVVLAGATLEALDQLYDSIPAHDFSRAVLERCIASLSVLAVPPCGWSDLGTPERLERYLGRRHVTVRHLESRPALRRAAGSPPP